MISDYHASYYAHELSRIVGTGVDRSGQELFDACVDLYFHQIEVGLVLSKYWVEPCWQTHELRAV